MPLQVFDKFYREMVRHIKANYAIGSRYLSTRQIAAKFEVSLQTAQKGVKKLCVDQIASATPKSGIFVKSLEPSVSLAGKKIVLLSDKHDKRFNDAFMEGCMSVAAGRDIAVEFRENTFAKPSSLAFGDYLLGLNADGVIGLAFSDTGLGFYHAMRDGLDMVVDIIHDDLPTLPAVQTDNFSHAAEAARHMAKKGFTNFLVAGYFPADKNRRYDGFLAGVDKSKATVTYACSANPQAMVTIDHFFYFFSERSAVFSADYASNYILAAKFVQHRVTVKNDNFMVYDAADDTFGHVGLPPVKAAAPSLKTLGAKLAETLIYKWENGVYPEPVSRRI